MKYHKLISVDATTLDVHTLSSITEGIENFQNHPFFIRT
jgi:hypothetical protein